MFEYNTTSMYKNKYKIQDKNVKRGKNEEENLASYNYGKQREIEEKREKMEQNYVMKPIKRNLKGISESEFKRNLTFC